MSKKMKETMTVDIKGFSAPFGDPSKKGKKKKKPWYLQDDNSLKESIKRVLSEKKLLAEVTSEFERVMNNAESGFSLNALIKHNKDILFRIFSKDESEMDEGEKAFLSQLRKKYGEDKINKKIAKVKGIEPESSGESEKKSSPNEFYKYAAYFNAAEESGKDLSSRGEFSDWLIDTFPEIKSSAQAKPIVAAWAKHKGLEDQSEDTKREIDLGKKQGEERKRELAGRLAVGGAKVGLSPDMPGQESPSKSKEKFQFTDLAMDMAANTAEKTLPTWSQIEEKSPNFAGELAQAYQRKVGRQIPKDFNKWASVFNDKVVGEIRSFKQEHGLKTSKFEPGKVRARGATFAKPRIKQKDQKKLQDPSLAGKRPKLRNFASIDKEMMSKLPKSPEGVPQDEMGEFKQGTSEKTVRNVLGRYDLSTIGDDELFDRRLRVFARQNGMDYQRLAVFVDVFNQMKDDEERGELRPASTYFAEMGFEPWNKEELAKFHDFLDGVESAYPAERSFKAKMDAPEDSEEGKKVLNYSPLDRKYVGRGERYGVDAPSTNIEDYFGDVLGKHWKQPENQDLGFKNPQLKNLMFKVFKDAASRKDKSMIPNDLLPVKATDEDGNSIVIRTVPELVRFVAGGNKGASGMSDQFEQFLIDFSNDYPQHFAALREKTVQIAKKTMPQEMEEDEALRAKEAKIKPKERKAFKGEDPMSRYKDVEGFSSKVSRGKMGTFSKPPHELDVEADVESDPFGSKASQLSKAGVYKDRDLASLKSLMRRFRIGRGKSSGPSNADLDAIENPEKLIADKEKFNIPKPEKFEKSPLLQKKRERRDKLRSKYGLEKLGVGGKEFKPKVKPLSRPEQETTKSSVPDFDFEDIKLSQDLSPEKQPISMSSQDVEDMQIMKMIGTLARMVAREKTDRGNPFNEDQAVKVFQKRLEKMGRFDMDVVDELFKQIEQEKFNMELSIDNTVKQAAQKYKTGDMSALISLMQRAKTFPQYLQDAFKESLRKHMPSRQKAVMPTNSGLGESLKVIDGSEFMPTVQKNKGWENGNLSKKKKFEPSTPSLKKVMKVILLGDGEGEDCDD